MSLRTSINLALAVGFDNALDDTLFERAHDELVDTLSKGVSVTRLVPANTADMQIDFGGITEARLIYIESDTEISFKLNGTGTTAIALKRLTNPTSTLAPTLCAYALLTVSATSLYLSNASLTTVANVKVCIVGDVVS